MACPADPTWRKYLADRYAQYASIHPRRLWREDDFSKTPEEFLPHEKNWASLLSSFGFATTIIPVQADLTIENQIIAIAGQLLRNLTNEQITNLITKNRVLLDGESIQVLLDRNFRQFTSYSRCTIASSQE